MNPPHWPHPSQEVAYFRDSNGTCFAAEIVRAPRWAAHLLLPPDEVVADIRIAFLDQPALPAGSEQPLWLAVLATADELEPALVVQAALEAWAAAPAYRGPGPAPEEYVTAGFQALCPPHPACTPGPASRESLGRFLRERPGRLGALCELGRDGFNRAVRMDWRAPEDFAEDILRERIGDEGGGPVLDLLASLHAAEIAPESSEFRAMAYERAGLLERLRPLRFFTDASDFDRAVEAARDWCERYARAYAAHYREVVEAAQRVLEEARPAVDAAAELDVLNREGRPVGEEASYRLRRAVAALWLLPPEVDERHAVTGDVALGRTPEALGEAHLAAAAVLAALEVQHFRGAARAARATDRRA
ncbi:MAG: hypothetical protein M0R73_04440 [Dehalococcoidia bacterium]|nr:hypothetical protein [Dehalococcoidia bacterium]